MRTIDLCCGIGGIRRGFELAGGYENVLSAEIDDYACCTYEHLYGENPKNDVKSDDFKKKLKEIPYDVLLAGFPCQTFSRIGLKKGFKDVTKGTIFFDIVKIIAMTIPKVVFLENVENLVSHNGGKTFKTIIYTLEKELNYHVIGVEHKEEGKLSYNKKDFLRNTKDFGLPQNRPRTYIIAFSRDYFGVHLEKLPTKIPEKGSKTIFDSVTDILEKDVPVKFFLASGFLKTLEDHKDRQRNNGNGFGYRIVNLPGAECRLSSTLLATGGSGKERNLVYDAENGKEYAGLTVKGKKTPINEKYIRYMTPDEWGKLQGFVGYGFLDENGIDRFSFPKKLSNQQRYKQLGNSVSIPVIEEMAVFIKKCLEIMEKDFSEEEKKLYDVSGSGFPVYQRICRASGNKIRHDTLKSYYKLVCEMGISKQFSVSDIARALSITNGKARQIVNQLTKYKCMVKHKRGVYSFSYMEEEVDLQRLIMSEEVSK